MGAPLIPRLRKFARLALGGLGLLGPAHRVRRLVHRARLNRYHSRLVAQYRSPFAPLIESYAPLEQLERERSRLKVLERSHADREQLLRFAIARYTGADGSWPESRPAVHAALAKRYAGSAGEGQRYMERIAGFMAALGSLPQPPLQPAGPAAAAVKAAREVGTAAARFEEDRAALVRALLDRVIDTRLAPRFYDYDYIEDIVGIVGGRYTSEAGSEVGAIASILDALAVLLGESASQSWDGLPARIRAVVGSQHTYVPPRGDVTDNVHRVIPEMVHEFMALKAESNPKRFLEMNREYSRRQAAAQGLWDHRQLSLLRGYERDYQLMLRKLVELIQQENVRSTDEILLIGPRYVDEVHFFRKALGLPKTVGLDLFRYGEDEILAGDMHDMPFEPGRFKLVFCAGTLSYSYNARKVIAEMARVLSRPGYVFLIDAAGRHAGPDALGRSDVMGIDTLLGMFYCYPFEVIAKDSGRTLAPDRYANEPCLALRLLKEPPPCLQAPGGMTDRSLYLPSL